MQGVVVCVLGRLKARVGAVGVATKYACVVKARGVMFAFVFSGACVMLRRGHVRVTMGCVMRFL